MSEQAPIDPRQLAAIANEQVAAGTGGTMIAGIGIEYLELSGERVVARLPVERNTQPYGILHGGATAALCETIGSIGTAFAVGLDKIVTGVELNVNHLKAVRSGHITGAGVPVHVGRTTAVWDIRVTDDDGRLVAVGRLTLVIRDQPAG